MLRAGLDLDGATRMDTSRRYARSVDNAIPPSEVVSRLAALRREHRDLDLEIEHRVSEIHADELTVKRLKKRKLWLKDCIARLESALIPDEPA